MKAKQLLMPMAFIFFALFFVSNVVKAQSVAIKMNALPAYNFGSWDPGDQNWQIYFYNTTTTQIYVAYVGPSNFDINNTETSQPLLYLPNGTYDVTFYYTNQTGEYGDIDHSINIDMGTPDVRDYCATSTNNGYVWQSLVLDNSVANTVMIYTAKDY